MGVLQTVPIHLPPPAFFMQYLGSDGLYHHRLPRPPRPVQHDRFQVVLRFQRGLELPKERSRQATVHTFTAQILNINQRMLYQAGAANKPDLPGFFNAGGGVFSLGPLQLVHLCRGFVESWKCTGRICAGLLLTFPTMLSHESLLRESLSQPSSLI